MSGHAHSFTIHSNFKIGNYLETSPGALLRSVSSMKPITVNKLHVNYIPASQNKLTAKFDRNSGIGKKLFLYFNY